VIGDEIAREFGGHSAGRSIPVLLFIPSVDRYDNPVDQAFWRDEALTVLGKLYGGATALPPGRGSWWDSELGQLLHESIVVIFCMAQAGDVEDLELTGELVRFLRRMGREASQGEVGMVIDGGYIGFTNYVED